MLRDEGLDLQGRRWSRLARLADTARGRVGAGLERGSRSGALRLAAAAWSAIAAARLARPLALPAGVRAIGIGGATLGGAGKTPVAIAVARALAARHAVALVGHAYRAEPGRARGVAANDAVELVGDDALAAARQLEGSGAIVVVAPSRQQAVDHAALQGARVLVIDGLLQAAPRRLDAAVLVLDAARPWGSGACPPAGDLRAPAAALRAAADVIAIVGPGEEEEESPTPGQEPHLVRPRRDEIAIASRIGGAAGGGLTLTPAELAQRRVGLILAVAHPERIEQALARLGIAPRAVLRFADHAGVSAITGPALAAGERHRIETWLTTARCATKLPAALGGAPVLGLRHEVDVRALVARLELSL